MEIAINTQASKEQFLLNYKDCLIYIKRDDLLHPEISGNKWRKLKYHIDDFYQGGYEQVLTFGGAFSNHLAATAAWGELAGVSTHALIRGEEDMDSPTLAFCRKKGMRLEGISRSSYSTKEDPEFLESLRDWLPGLYIIPEGGKGPQALKGCAEIKSELTEHYDFIAVSAGTGATAAGVLSALDKEQLWVYPALKSESFMAKAIMNQVLDYYRHYGIKEPNFRDLQARLKLRHDYHFGGYAKINEDLVRFMNESYDESQVKLDPVYTAKMLFGLLKDIDQGLLKAGSRILVLHTGGLQGIKGMNRQLVKKGKALIKYE